MVEAGWLEGIWKKIIASVLDTWNMFLNDLLFQKFIKFQDQQSFQSLPSFSSYSC